MMRLYEVPRLAQIIDMPNETPHALIGARSAEVR